VLGRIGTEEARQSLIAALSDKDKDLAATAAGALGQMGMNDQVKTALLGAARDNPQVKMQVMNQLINAGAPEGLRLAEEMLTGKDVPGANSAVWALAQQGTPEAKRLIERALTSQDKSVRMAAISTLATNPDDQSTDTLLRLTRDSDAQVRASALSTLGQIGSERAQTAIIEATRAGKPEERIAAISGLASMEDPRASQQLATLMKDTDPQVAQTAIQSAYNGGPEVDVALSQIVNDTSAKPEMRQAAANQLRGRGADLDDATEKAVTTLAGPVNIYGGYGYGGHRGGYYMD
jgi:HEAT repeat protein